ncbi:MAG: hypothetical protein R3B54_00885 [Bdellovibrionota bacterium]
MHEPRVFQLMDVNDKALCMLGSCKPVNEGPRRGERTMDRLVIGADGEAVGLRKEGSGKAEQLRRELFGEYVPELFRRAIGGDQEAYDILQKASGSALGKVEDLIGLDSIEKDFDLFIRVNMPILSDVPTRAHVPAGQLVKKLSELLRSDPDKWKPIVRDFYMKGGFVRIAEHAGSGLEGRGFEGLSLAHPLVAFALEDRYDLFPSRDDKVHLLGRTSALEPPRSQMGYPELKGEGSELYLSSVRKHLGYERPKTAEELYKLLESFGKRPGGFFANLAAMEAELFRIHHPKQELDPIRVLPYLGGDWKERTEAIEKTFSNYVKNRKDWPKSARTLLNEFTLFDEAGLFPEDGVLRYKLIENILDRLSEYSSPALRQGAIERIFKGRRVQDPKLRTRLLRLWALSARERFGTDTGDPIYTDSILAEAERAGGHLYAQDRHELFNHLANEVESQEDLSLKLGEARKGQGAEADLKMMGLNLSMRLVRANDEFREQLVDFLTRPMTPTSLADFGHVLSLEQRGLSDGETIGTDEGFQRLAREIHQNFWASDMELRVGIIDELILPGDRRNDTEFEKATERILKKVFPSGEKYSQEAHDLVRLYIEEIRSTNAV